MVSRAACSTISLTVFVSSNRGSCSRNPTVKPGEMTVSPTNSLSIPARILKSELLPEPLRPMTPIFAP
jgi:hypothetical protein